MATALWLVALAALPQAVPADDVIQRAGSALVWPQSVTHGPSASGWGSGVLAADVSMETVSSSSFSALRSRLSALRSPLSALCSLLSALGSPFSTLCSPLSALRFPTTDGCDWLCIDSVTIVRIGSGSSPQPAASGFTELPATESSLGSCVAVIIAVWETVKPGE